MKSKPNTVLVIVYITTVLWFVKVERERGFVGTSQGLVITLPIPQSKKMFSVTCTNSLWWFPFDQILTDQTLAIYVCL